MSQSDFSYGYEVTTFRGRKYSIGARLDPSINNVESFAILLYFQLADGTRVEVAKVDDSPHEEGDIHVDRYYREVGAEVKDFDTDIEDWTDAEDYLKENGQRFARLYHENHGTEVRADGANG
ncbi:DUF7718 family protein [Haloplanus rubicundus]|uniref:DUF7718 family protein n=1 Tax=Haloplanus rubicundus TaxID=1547898 RepID=UPI00130088CD|nr:hypothetical protein [Haloplanus rubicundus]